MKTCTSQKVLYFIIANVLFLAFYLTYLHIYDNTPDVSLPAELRAIFAYSSKNKVTIVEINGDNKNADQTYVERKLTKFRNHRKRDNYFSSFTFYRVLVNGSNLVHESIFLEEIDAGNVNNSNENSNIKQIFHNDSLKTNLVLKNWTKEDDSHYKLRDTNHVDKNYIRKTLKPKVSNVADPVLTFNCKKGIVLNVTSRDFSDKISLYNQEIGKLRELILARRGKFSEWKDVNLAENLNVIWGAHDNFTSRLCAEHDGIKLVGLKWDYSERGINLLHRNYFAWTGDELLCDWITSEGRTKAHWDAVYNKECTVLKISEDNKDILDYRGPLEYLYLNYKTINPAHYWPNDGLAYPQYF